MVNFSISPAELLNKLGWKYQQRKKYLTVRVCPVCGGGQSRDQFTFAVHATDGNYFCLRGKCPAKGNFWSLIEESGLNPTDFLDRTQPKQRKKNYIYGK